MLGVDPTTGRGAGRRDTEDIERLVEEVVNEKLVELHHRIMDRVRQELEAFEERVAQRGVDERMVKSIARAVADQEFAKLHSVVMEEITRVRGEVEALARQGVDVEVIKRLVEDAYGKVLDDVKRILDQRIAHIISVIDEQGNEVKDVLDLVNEVLKLEVEFEEKIEKLWSEVRRALSEEAIEEYVYRVLVRKGVLRKRRRRWVPLIVGLGILAAIVTGLLLSPIVTLVILFIVFVVLLRW